MIPQDEMREGYRLSLQQARLAALAARNGYHPAPLAACIRIDGPLDQQRLWEAIDAVLACHESLRTRIEYLPGTVTPVQVIGPPDGSSRIVTALPGPVDARSWAASVVSDGQPLRLGLHAPGADQYQVIVAAARDIADPASLFVFARDLARACGGEKLSPEDVLQYADYAEWQRELLEGADEAATQYWRRPGLSDLLLRPVPLASPSHNQTPVNRAVRPLVVPDIAILAKLSADHRVHPAEVLLAAWSAWLGRLCGQPEVLIGLTCDARNEELEDACGAYQRVLPLRLAVPMAMPFAELVRAVHGARTEAEDHGDYFTWELTDAGPVGSGTQPVCPLGFGYVRAADGGRLPVALTCPMPLEPHAFYLGVLEGPDGLQIEFHSDSHRISPEAAECLCEQFGTLLSGALREPDRPVAALPLLATAERARVLAVEPGVELDDAVDGGLHGLFERAARTTPSAPALVHDGAAWTYAELNALANRLAWRLQALGVTRESRIGVAAGGPVDMIAGALAALKAGGVYVPMDPKHPGERLAALARDAALTLLLGDRDLADRVGELPCRVLCLAEEFPHLDRYAAEKLAEPVESGQAAYLIYTSGSTGQPKGVVVTHRNAVQSTRARLAYYPRADGHFLLLSAFTFDSSIAGIFGTLAAGGCLVLPRDGAVQDLASLEQLMTAARVSQLLCVPSLYAVLLEQLGTGVLQALDTVIVAGEACPAPLVRRHHERLPHVDLVNEYGPTEATVWCTAYRTRQDDDLAPVSIGRGVAHVRVYVLDERLEPVPRGVAGELYVGGAGVARGYWRRPALTAAAFVPDPFGTPGARMYRTGDRARYEIDGRLTFLGRQDHQLKIRGFRIEPGEIESILGEHPAVRSAVVTAHVEKSGEARLVAYLTLATADSVLDGLKEFAARRLPDYMVPVAWTVLPRLPLTPHGKIDRQALPEPAAPSSQHYVAPRNPAETVLAGIWCELLRVERVGVEDNFFALGGDSILSIQMVSRARQQGLAITARQVFATPTIAALAASEPAASNTEACSPHRGPVPLTPIQRWFFALDYPSPNRWTHAVLLRLLQPVDDTVLAAAAEAVVRHHDALRMQYRRVASGWEQSVRSEVPPGTFVRATPAEGGETDDEILRRAAETWGEIDVATEALLRVVAVDTASDRHVLVVVHHLVADGLSWRIVLEDLGIACDQLGRGAAVELPPVTTPLARWAERLQDHARSPSALAELPLWLDPALDDARTLPVDDPDGDATEAASAVLRVALGPEETSALLRDIHTAYNTRIDDVLLAALAHCLSVWTGRDTVRVDLDRHGREPLFDAVDLSRTVGWFTSVVPLALRGAPAAAPGDRLTAVKEQLRAQPHHGIHYGMLRYLTGDDAGTAALRRQPTAPVIFNYLGRIDSVFDTSGDFELVDGQVTVGADPAWQRPYELAVNADVFEGRLRIEWAYSRGRLRPATVERLAAAYTDALRELIAHCRAVERPVRSPSDFPLAPLDRVRLERLLASHPDVDDIYPATAVQAGMLFHSRLRPEAGYYVQQIAVTLTGALDRAAFAAAWAEVQRRHAVLRTAFADDERGGLLQLVLPEVALPLIEQDWRGSSREQQHGRWRDFEAEDRSCGFDPAVAPLMRLALIRLADDRYRLLWSHHHALIDGWCPGLVFGELLAIYAATAQGDDARLPPAPAFREYLAWLQRQDREAAGHYWSRLLAGFDEPTPLGIDRAAIDGDAGCDDVRRSLPASLTEALEAFARQHQLTLNTLIQGAWALLLSRYGGGDDIVFGVTLSGRPAELPGIERMVGLFINTLPLRVRTPSSMPVVDWLKGLLTLNAELRQFEYSDLGEVQRHAAIPKGRALFESIVVFENYPIERSIEATGAALGVESVEFTEQTHYPLALVAVPGERLELQLRYARGRFAGADIERLAEHLESLLGAFVERPGAALGTLSVLSPEALQAVVRSGRPQPVPMPLDDSLMARFGQVAATCPDAVAVRCQGVELSYRELAARAERLCARLRAEGVGPEHRVGLCVERGLDLIVGVLGILQAGAAYVPLNPDQPALRLAELIADAGLRCVVADAAGAGMLPPEVVPVDVAGLAAGDEAVPGRHATTAIDPDQAAYVIYTSGSTGRPKGVVVSHRNVLRLFDTTQPHFGFGPGDVWSLFHSYAFDFSVWELWGALLYGGTVVIVPQEATRDTYALHRLLVDEGVTVLSQTPSSFYRLDAVDSEAGRTLGSLRSVVFGGEALDPVRLADWFAHYGDRSPALINMYGITETTVHVTLQPLVADHARGDRGSVIGRALDDLGVLLMDAAGQPVPDGLPGEVLVAGCGLARGYLGQPGLTAERFVPHPFGLPGERLYRSGDLARRLSDGTLQYLGRIDEQVKIRGYRIELGEIAGRLMERADIADARVIAHRVRDGELMLVAYLVARGEAPTDERLRGALRECLPEYMVPTAYVWLDALPLTVNGKLDRRALPPPVSSRIPEDRVLPQTATEAVLAEIWKEVLQVEAVGVHDNFFDLGGHSLLATQLVSRIRTSLQREVPLALVFEQPTIAGLAALINTGLPATDAATMPAIVARSREGRRIKRSELAR